MLYNGKLELIFEGDFLNGSRWKGKANDIKCLMK